MSAESTYRGLEMLNGIPVISLGIESFKEHIKESRYPPSIRASYVDGFEAGVRAARKPAPDVSRLLAAAREADRILNEWYAPRETLPDSSMIAKLVDQLRAALAEHEAARSARIEPATDSREEG